MIDGNEDHLQVMLEPRLESCAYAREVTRATFGKRLPERVFNDLLTVVGELVTNAVRHGPGDVAISLELSLDAPAGVIRGEVVDQGDASESIPRIRSVTKLKGGGYGLRLVDAMTSEWRVVEGSTTVQFEIPLAG